MPVVAPQILVESPDRRKFTIRSAVGANANTHDSLQKLVMEGNAGPIAMLVRQYGLLVLNKSHGLALRSGHIPGRQYSSKLA